MNGPFILHGGDAIPLDCNTTPLPECTIRPVLRNGEVIKAVEVPMKGCASLWLRCQAEAEKWLTDARTGRLVDDPVRINRRINSAYAFLWLTDRRFQWAGLAAFASKQVGCGLLHAARTIAETGAEIRKRPGQDSFEFLSKNLYELGAGMGSEQMYAELALGNLHLFLDIYPLHRFFMLASDKSDQERLAHLGRCLKDRQSIEHKVLWKLKPGMLRFGTAQDDIIKGFTALVEGRTEESVQALAHHEQVNILQKIIYDNPATQAALAGNQFAWVSGLPSGRHAEIKLSLSAHCNTQPGLTAWFTKKTAARLWDKDERMQFVLAAAKQFHKLLQGKERLAVERSITEIYHGGA